MFSGGLRPFISTLILLLALASNLEGGFGERGVEANDAIERFRKGDAFLSVVDDEDKPITGALIRYKQVTRDFLFGVAGANLPPTLLAGAGINYVEVYVSWNVTDRPDYRDWVEYTYKPLISELGLVLSGHCLVWMVGSYPDIPGADPWNLPTRVKTLGYDELKRELYDHVYETVSDFKSLISYWGINEPFWPYADPFHLTTAQWLEIVRLSVQAIKKADPTAKIYMNNIIGDFPPLNYYPVEHMKLLLDSGIDFDAIGLEVYGEDRSPGVPLDGKDYPVIPWVSNRLDQFGKLGKPIILTEVDITTEPSQKAQAEWLREFYTMTFTKSYVKGIAWSFTFDDPFLPKGGLVEYAQNGGHLELKGRQAYYALKNLTSSWLTEGSGTTDAEGNARFRGFAGNYSITVNARGFKPVEAIVHVPEQTESQFQIRMSLETPSETTLATAVSKTSMHEQVTSPALSPQQAYAAVIVVSIACVTAFLLKRRIRKDTGIAG